MSVFIGLLTIFSCHYLLGLIYGSSFFVDPDIFYALEYIVLIIIGVPSGILATRSDNWNNYYKWIIFSTVPGLLFMTYARAQDHSGGLMPTSWDWGLWELILPAIYLLSQLILIFYFISTRGNKDIVQDNRETNRGNRFCRVENVMNPPIPGPSEENRIKNNREDHMPNNPRLYKGTNEEANYVRNKLIEYNAVHVPNGIYEEVNLCLKNDTGDIIAGLNSAVCWNWMEIDILWVEEKSRKQGFGKRLLDEAEKIAKAKKCTFIKLNTFSFQAPEFYTKYGYKEIAIIENAPLGSNHYYFKKDLR